jgi:hypothetical protein
MVDVAARSSNGVKIPGKKATRAEIMRTFKNHLTRLTNTLNVSNHLSNFGILSTNGVRLM